MSDQTTIAIIQGRMGSSRLPGKVLRDLGGKPMLERVITRVSRSRFISDLVVATTEDPSDDPIVEFCQTHAVPVYRGSLYDVLDRYYQAALLYHADVIVRITADCPMIDPAEIDRVIAAFFEGECDFAANRLPPPNPRTSPIGMDTEVCSFAALETAWKNATEKFEREHVMPYLYDTPGRFRVKVVETEPSMGHLRFTVDTEADLQVARAVYAAFDNRDDFTLNQLLGLSALHPQWQYSLADIQHKTYLEVDERSPQAPKMPATNEQSDQTGSPPLTTPKTVICPLCDKKRVKALKKFESFGSPVVYYHCQSCGFIFQDASESRAAAPDFYREEYRKIYQSTSAPTAKDLRQQQLRSADQIHFLRSRGVARLKRILDIGASSGAMLEAFRIEFQAEGVGVEPGDAYRKLAEAKGLHMYSSLESLSACNPERFDLVSLMHVLEHLENPVGVLRDVRQDLLDPQGWLLLEVPNFYAHDCYELAHLTCFTSHSIVETLHKAGYEVVFLRKHGYPRSEMLNLYLNVLAKPSPNPENAYRVRPESAVPLKRSFAMLRRKVLSKLSPGRAWLPLEDKK